MTGDDFPAALDDWTASDWADYRARVEDGEGSAHAIDAVQRRRRRQQPSRTSQEKYTVTGATGAGDLVQPMDLEDSHLSTARRRESP
ncbi:hypothetical protein [Streptomyces sp. NBC_00582]|uniref:hypothetical protein n=1 Tax=Streptomyces sp. NBC_00582 TaxID=2975783 RepID=UPI002E819850|nr:hypothetical protein [Streptomyces sp. NBC_00582]WUB58978.1 hypothetical protein OG852_00160 [Streptomyces sp. NBC_00582]WUB67749.1 hypothetical protein OG852_48975 [Streptomyces sp. NBC_00582]